MPTYLKSNAKPNTWSQAREKEISEHRKLIARSALRLKELTRERQNEGQLSLLDLDEDEE